MNTFLLFALIFVPFAWLIWRMLRYTEETIGTRSPVYSSQTYSVTSIQYFGTLGHITLLGVAVLMLALVDLIVQDISKQPSVLIVLLIPLVTISFIGFYLRFDWQYWKLVRRKTITMNPSEPSIRVDDGKRITLTPETVTRIEQHVKHSNNAKDLLGSYGYYVFYFGTSQAVILSNTYFLHNEFLDRYFKSVPQSRIEHKLPWPPAFTTELCQSAHRSE